MSGWREDPIVARPRWEADPVVTAPGARRAEPLIVVGAGLPVPELIRLSTNPNSAGRFPIGRRYTVGDEATLQLTNTRETGARAEPYAVRVTAVDEATDRVEVNDGDIVWDLMGNHLKAGGATFDPARQVYPAELYVGKRWRAVYRAITYQPDRPFPVGVVRDATLDFAITGRERVRVPAGEFDAFRVDGSGGGRVSLTETLWLVPYLNFPIRWDRDAYDDRSGHRRYLYAERRELVAARQFAVAN